MFHASDNERTLKVVVINDTAARQYWPNEDAVGKVSLMCQPPINSDPAGRVNDPISALRNE